MLLEGRITELKRELVEYAALVERMIEKSTRGLIQKDKNLLTEVIEIDEPLANQKEIELDEICTTIIAQFQPAAKDLRTILMVLKINNDLERLGDHAVNIAQSALYLIERPPVDTLIDIPEMAQHTISMLKDSINSFVKEDALLCDEVCERDSVVDRLRLKILKELIVFMTEDSATIERALHLDRISKNLERIADLSTNICEDVIFMVEGRVIKHHQEESEDEG
jgi:phosphate transport system protein